MKVLVNEYIVFALREGSGARMCSEIVGGKILEVVAYFHTMSKCNVRDYVTCTRSLMTTKQAAIQLPLLGNKSHLKEEKNSERCFLAFLVQRL
jgi:hypothetical protein